MSTVRYVPIDGESVSREHYAWMSACREDGVRFRVNEGHRTMARQTFFWNNQPPLAAFPSANAPHIQTGSPNHANDIDQFFGDGVRAVIAWLRKHGAKPTLPVPGEGWHLQLSDADLAMLFRKFNHRSLSVGDKGEDVQRAQVMLRGIGRWDHKAGKTFGTRMKGAVVGYQRSQGIKADGVLGPVTLKHLEADYYRKHPR